MTEKQLDMVKHALGLPENFRNHFCLGKGCDGYEDWEDLVRQGLATKALGGDEWAGDFFRLTPAGIGEVIRAYQEKKK